MKPDYDKMYRILKGPNDLMTQQARRNALWLKARAQERINQAKQEILNRFLADTYRRYFPDATGESLPIITSPVIDSTVDIPTIRFNKHQLYEILEESGILA